MATKVKCPNCGAKNAPGLHRCRLCTHVIDPSAEEGLPKGLVKQAKLDARLASAAARRQRAADAEAGAPPAPPDPMPPVQPMAPDSPQPFAEPIVAGPPVVFEAPAAMPVDDDLVADDVAEPADLPDGAIVIDASPRHVANPTMDEPLDAPESWDAVSGIEIDVVSRHPGAAAPPLEYGDDGFDPDALVIDPPR